MSDTATAAAEQPAVDTKSTEEKSAEPKAKSEAKPSQKPATKEERKESAKTGLRDYLKRKAAEDAGEEDDAPAKSAKKAEPAKESAPKASEPKAKQSEPSDKAEKLADKIEDAGGDAPDQKQNESDKQYELRLAKTLRDLRDAKAEALKARKDAETSGAELKKLQKLIDGGKANPLTILDHLGVSYEDLTKGIVEERFKPAHKRIDLPPEIMEKIERLEAADKEREAERVKSAAIAELNDWEAKVRKHIEDHSDDFPLCGNMQWAARQIAQKTQEEKLSGAEALEALKELEENLATNVVSLLGSDKATKKLLKRDAKLAGLLKAALGLDALPVAAAKSDDEDEKPKVRSLAGAATEASGKPMTKEERKAAAAVALRARRAKQSEEDDED